MLPKPDRVFDRDREWNGLTSFASNPVRGALLGMVSGRRRQGKSFLLEALTSVVGGLYFPSLEETEAVGLRTFSTALIRQGVPVSRPLQNWGDAIALLFGALRDQPRTAVIDEFPFLAKATSALPSLIQRALKPSAQLRNTPVRLLLCGSALSFMGKLRSPGLAPELAGDVRLRRVSGGRSRR